MQSIATMARMKKNQSLKRTIKFLATNVNPQITKLILAKSGDSVVKGISNADLNAYKGKIRLPPKTRSKFSKHRKVFEKLTSSTIPIAKKRRLLVTQRGGGFAALIPILLSTVLSTFGSSFLNKS